MMLSCSLSVVLALCATGSLCVAAPPDEPVTVSKDMALTMILAHEDDAGPISKEIHKLQEVIKGHPNDMRRIEQLGRLFITQARLENDPGCYKLAELCSTVIESIDANNPAALLLRGHALLAMHRFHDAEVIARRLLTLRQDMVDHALLGDALMEQGRLEEALPVYQRMMDTKPCLPSYSRVAHMRWLKGDLPGAIEMMEEAIACGSYRDPEPMAWVTARLALLQWQNGDSEAALKTADRALAIVPDYPHALWVVGRVHLAQHQTQPAITALEKAIAKSPLPELQWALIDAYRVSGDSAKAEAVEATLKRSGAAEDPRSFSLYLATQGLLPERALSLAKAELQTRSDVFTHDAVAWAQHAVGQHAEALASIRNALAEGTQDARMFLHAGIIAQASSSNKEANQWLGKAQSMRGLLLPSEQSALDRSLAAVAALSTRPDQPSLVNDNTK